MSENHKTNDDVSNIDDKKTVTNYLLTQESFDLLRQAQQEINKRSDLTPSLRKIVNRIITKEAIDDVTQQFINELT